MCKKLVIGLGNCGTNIVKEAAYMNSMDDVTFYTIDSVASNISMDTVARINNIPIISDDKTGSGRNRERGRAMFEYHENHDAFDEMYQLASETSSPVIVISSSSGGTGSGSMVPLCKTLTDMGVKVIPIIVIPALEDPIAYHMNTTDLFIELGEAVEGLTYATFRNVKNSADYTAINKEIVTFMEIIFGKYYGDTEKDSIDDSDLDQLLNMPGRLLAIYAVANNVINLQKAVTAKVFSGYQPAWTELQAAELTLMKGYSMKSMFAATDYETVFENVNARIKSSIDEYRNLEVKDNNGLHEATVIIAGLQRPELKEVDFKYTGASSINTGINKPSRPSFMSKKKGTVVQEKSTDGKSIIDKFKWN